MGLVPGDRRAEAERESTVARAAGLSGALNRVAEGQERLVELAQSRADQPAPVPPDLSGIETALQRMVADLNEGRDEMLAELRSDILVLTRAVRAARFGDPFRDDLLHDPLIDRGAR